MGNLLRLLTGCSNESEQEFLDFESEYISDLYFQGTIYMLISSSQSISQWGPNNLTNLTDS